MSNLTSIGARERANGHALSLSALNDSMTTSPPAPPSNTKPVATTSLLPGGQDQNIKKWEIGGDFTLARKSKAHRLIFFTFKRTDLYRNGKHGPK